MQDAIRCGVNAEKPTKSGVVEVEMNFTPSQLAWARSHDWFISGNLSEIVCRDEWTKDGQLHIAAVTHTNFQTLREWAGY